MTTHQAPAADDSAATTKLEKALAVIEKRPGILTEDLAKAMGIQAADLNAYIGRAVRNGFVVSCDYTRPGQRTTKQYKLQAGAKAGHWKSWLATQRGSEDKAPGAAPLTVAKPILRPGSETQGSSKIGGECPPLTVPEWTTKAGIKASPPAKESANLSSVCIPIGSYTEHAAEALIDVSKKVGMASWLAQEMAAKNCLSDEENPMEETIELAHWMNVGQIFGCDTPEKLRGVIDSLERQIVELIEHEQEDNARASQAEAQVAAMQPRLDALVEKTKDYEIRLAELQAEFNRRIDGEPLAKLEQREPDAWANIDAGCLTTNLHDTRDEAIKHAEQCVSMGVKKSAVYRLYLEGVVRRETIYTPAAEITGTAIDLNTQEPF